MVLSLLSEVTTTTDDMQTRTESFSHSASNHLSTLVEKHI